MLGSGIRSFNDEVTKEDKNEEMKLEENEII